MNDPDWLGITILLQGNFTSIFSFGGVALDPTSGQVPPAPLRVERCTKSLGVYIRLKQIPLNNHASHPTMGSSPSKKNFLLETWLSPLSSFLHGTPRGSVVTLLMSSGVSSMERPLTTIVAWILLSGMREREKYQATSSSYPLNFFKNPIQLCLVNISSTWGCCWILTVFVGSLY